MNAVRYKYLKNLWIINWCGAKGKFNFSLFIDYIIKFFHNFKQKKYNNFHNKIKLRVCGPHDVRFYNWWFIFAYIWANLKFAYDLYLLLWWTNIFIAFLIFILAFIILMIWWIGAFNWCFYWNKKDITF